MENLLTWATKILIVFALIGVLSVIFNFKNKEKIRKIFGTLLTVFFAIISVMVLWKIWVSS